jgi:predicted nucleic acid-binding protein
MKQKPIPVYTADASLILKWYTESGESELEKALKLRDEYRSRRIEIVSPELLIYEVSNVLRFKKSLEEKYIIAAVESLFELRILRPVNQEIMKGAVKLALEYNITVYDSTYLSFALYHKFPLITADEKLIKKIKNLPDIIFLGDIKY